MTEQEERDALFAIGDIADAHGDIARKNGWTGISETLEEIATLIGRLEARAHKEREDYLQPKQLFIQNRKNAKQK